MIRTYQYELWNGKEVIGHYLTSFQLLGSSLQVPEVSIFKQSYFSKPKVIKVPVITRLISDDGVDTIIRRCLDVCKKSKRQINLLKQNLTII